MTAHVRQVIPAQVLPFIRVQVLPVIRDLLALLFLQVPGVSTVRRTGNVGTDRGETSTSTRITTRILRTLAKLQR